MRSGGNLGSDGGVLRRRKLIDVIDVAESNLCSGCGVCAAVAPSEIVMVDDLDQGRRPLRIAQGDGAKDALKACPGAQLARAPGISAATGYDEALVRDWGPVRAMWEGYSSDERVRYIGSSGGVATALSAFALRSGFDGVVHIGADDEVRWRNRTFVSRTPDEVALRAGSRYSPASPGEGLTALTGAEGRFVFVGKPCDVAGAHMAASIRPEIARSLDLTIAIFCAGTPTFRGTIEMLQAMGVELDDLKTLRFRGHGWPGDAVAETTDGERRHLSYEESWGGILQAHRQWRCKICPDHTGEFADISVGDPWYRPTAGDPGRSLIVARTERGEAFVRRAIASGVISVVDSPHRHLPESQPNLERGRGRVWGRLLAMRLMRMPTPKYDNMGLAQSWMRNLPPREWATSIVGAALRIRRGNLRSRRPVQPVDAKRSP